MKVPVQRLVLIEKSSRVQEILKADTEAVDEVTVSASCTSRTELSGTMQSVLGKFCQV